MATESVATAKPQPYCLPIGSVDEANKLIYQARAVCELLCDARNVIDCPEEVIDGVTWLLRDHLARLKVICDTRDGGHAEATP